MEDCIRFKYTVGDETRVMSVPPDVGINELREALARACRRSVPPARITYVDDDGDVITIRDDHDLSECVCSPTATTLRAGGLPCTRLCVTFTPSLSDTATNSGSFATGTTPSSTGSSTASVYVPEDLSAAREAPFEWMLGAPIVCTHNSVVCNALRLDTGELIIVKQISIMPEAANQLRNLEREVNLMKEHVHENVVGYLGAEVKGAILNVFMEYVPG
eukprot:PhM_4_TR6131/c2_g1_i1/m.55770